MTNITGEGNFSFARVLADKLSSIPNCHSIDLIATDFVTRNEKLQTNSNADELSYLFEQFTLDESIQDNIRYLNSLDVPIWLDVDSTKLDVHKQLCQTLSSDKYSSIVIVFNFPHVHNIKMKVKQVLYYNLLYFLY